MISKRNLLLALWVLNHAMYVYAFTFSGYPNQLHWAYQIACLLIGLFLFWKPSANQHSLPELTLLVSLYFGGFALVSLWEVFPGTSFAWGKFELINAVIAINGYFFARFVPWVKVLRGYSFLAILCVLYVIGQIVFQADLSRYGYGQQLMLCLPAATILGHSYLVAIAIVAMLASFHKTALIAGILGTALVLMLKKRTAAVRHQRSRFLSHPEYRFLRGALTVILLPCVLAVPFAFSGQIVTTLSRFMSQGNTVSFGDITAEGEGEDLLRTYINDASLSLLPRYWYRGMGFMNFYEWTSRDRRSSRTTRLGYEEDGLNLHNSYMTWLLEGGPVVVLCVVALFWRTGRHVRALLRRPLSRPIGNIALAWCLSLLVFGMFHQLHASIQLWGTVGVIFGLADQFRVLESKQSTLSEKVRPIAVGHAVAIGT